MLCQSLFIHLFFCSKTADRSTPYLPGIWQTDWNRKVKLLVSQFFQEWEEVQKVSFASDQLYKIQHGGRRIYLSKRESSLLLAGSDNFSTKRWKTRKKICQKTAISFVNLVHGGARLTTLPSVMLIVYLFDLFHLNLSIFVWGFSSGSQRSRTQTRSRPKLDLEAWRSHHFDPWV